MKIAVIGSRGFDDYDLVRGTLDTYTIELIVSGGALGADYLGARYAHDNNISTLIIKPDWDSFNKAAGMIRNKDIIDACEFVVAFWDGESKGTKQALNYARKCRKPMEVICYNELQMF